MRLRSLVPYAAALGSVLQTAAAQTKADFLLVERPHELRIRNQYQQEMSPAEKAGLVAFSPFKILKADDLLGDGFTPCMKVEAGGVLFFLQKETDGTLLGAASAGFHEVVRSAIPLSDTVQITAKNGVAFTNPQKTNRATLARGTTFVRVFRSKEWTYGKALSPERFGWLRLDANGEGKEWTVVKQQLPTSSEQLVRVLPKVEVKVNDVNNKLALLFDHFSRTTRRSVQAPRWILTTDPDSIVCVLDSSLDPQAFAESTALLGKTLEAVLLGTTLRVLTSPGRIAIR